MSMEIHERPGVYSAYDASAVVSGSGGSKTVAIVAQWDTHVGETLLFTRYENLVETLGASEKETDLVALAGILLKNGAAAVQVSPVMENAGLEQYKAAFEQVNKTEDAQIVVCDSTDQTVQQALRDSVQAASAASHRWSAWAAWCRWCGASPPGPKQEMQRIPLGGSFLPF